MRTEIGRAYSVAGQERMGEVRQYLPGLKKRWLKSGKLHGRLEHIAADGQVREVDEPFDIGGEKLMYPRDPNGSAKNTINCGCESISHMDHWEVSEDAVTDARQLEPQEKQAERIDSKPGLDPAAAAGETSQEEVQRKISSVNIDFNRDNALPGLNKENLEALGKPDRPMLFNKSTVSRNQIRHPELHRSEYNALMGKALYGDNFTFPGHKRNYVNFVSRREDGRYALVLVDMSERKAGYEVVHVMKINKRNLDRMQKKKPG
jgi:hypothetical protein